MAADLGNACKTRLLLESKRQWEKTGGWHLCFDLLQLPPPCLGQNASVNCDPDAVASHDTEELRAGEASPLYDLHEVIPCETQKLYIGQRVAGDGSDQRRVRQHEVLAPNDADGSHPAVQSHQALREDVKHLRIEDNG